MCGHYERLQLRPRKRVRYQEHIQNRAHLRRLGAHLSKPSTKTASGKPAMSFATASGMSSMLKDGAKQMSGLEEAVLKNVRKPPSLPLRDF